MVGRITTIESSRGFGFVRAGLRDVFFHRTDVGGREFDRLREGDVIEFDLVETEKGPRAEHVREVPKEAA